MKTTSFKRLLAMLMAMLLTLSMVTSALSVELQWDKTEYDTAVTDLSSQTTENTIEATSEGFAFSVAGQLPAQAQLDVSTWDAETTAYIRTDILGLPELEEGMTEHAFDITILSGTQEWQPNESVTVDITGLNVDENSEVTVYHIPDNAAPAVATYSLERTSTAAYEVVENVTVSEGKITFAANGFSTYYVAILSGLSQGIQNGDIYYMVPGTSLTLTRSGYTFSVTSSPANPSGVSWSNASGSCTISTERFAEDTTLTVTAGNRTVTVYVSTEKFITAALDDSQYPAATFESNGLEIWFGIIVNPNDGMPSEPSVDPYSDYDYITSNYTVSGNGYNGYFAKTAKGIISPTIYTNNKNDFVSSQDGTNTIGIVDYTGAKIKNNIISGSIDWSRVESILANANKFYATDGTLVTNANVSKYEFVPYVIKLQLDSQYQRGWHIDGCFVPKERVTLSYHLNLPSGAYMGLDGVQYAAPNPVNEIPTFTRNVEKISSSSSSNPTVELNETIRVYDANGQTLEMTFLGWKDEENNKTYEPGNTISVEENTDLYAQWSVKLLTGDISISKTVQMLDSTVAPPDTDFMFSVNVTPNAEVGTVDTSVSYNYIVSDSTGEVRRGTIKLDGINNLLALKHGQSVRIYNVPIGAYTIQEASNSDYEPSWPDGTSTKQLTGGGHAVFACTNTEIIKTGSLLISKTVQKDATAANLPATPDTFEFTVSLTDENGSALTGTYAYTGSRSGNISHGGKITLTNGQSITIADLPAGTQYVVTEATKDYYTATASIISGNITAGATATAAFTNTYTKLPVGDLTINKTVKDVTFTSGSKTFSFTLALNNGSDVAKKQFKEWAEAKSYTYDETKVSAAVSIEVASTDAGLTKSLELKDLPIGSYTVTETPVEGYVTAYAPANGAVTVAADATATVTVTNTITATRDITVNKVWQDNSNKYQTRPATISLELLGNGETVTSEVQGFTNPATVTGNSDTWTYTWEDVPTFDENGAYIVYTVDEVTVDEYTVTNTESIVDGTKDTLTITNTVQRAQLKITKSGLNKKIYSSGDHESALFTVQAVDSTKDSRVWNVAINGDDYVIIDGVKIGVEYTVAENNNWTWRYANQSAKNVTIVAGENAVSFSNSHSNDKWLGGDNYANNNFGTGEIEKVD